MRRGERAALESVTNASKSCRPARARPLNERRRRAPAFGARQTVTQARQPAPWRRRTTRRRRLPGQRVPVPSTRDCAEPRVTPGIAPRGARRGATGSGSPQRAPLPQRPWLRGPRRRGTRSPAPAGSGPARRRCSDSGSFRRGDRSRRRPRPRAHHAAIAGEALPARKVPPAPARAVDHHRPSRARRRSTRPPTTDKRVPGPAPVGSRMP